MTQDISIFFGRQTVWILPTVECFCADRRHTVWPINSNSGLVYSAVSALSESRPFTIYAAANKYRVQRYCTHRTLSHTSSNRSATGIRFRVKWFRSNQRRQTASLETLRLPRGMHSINCVFQNRQKHRALPAMSIINYLL